MKTALLLLCALTPFAASAAPPVEAFAGYSAGLVQPGGDADRVRVGGFTASATVYPWSRVGITTDLSGLDGSVHPANTMNAGPVSGRQYGWLAGPQIRLLRIGRLETSVKALAGAAHRRGFDTMPSETSAAALIGSNLDWRLNRRLAFRVSPGMHLTQFGSGSMQRDFRVSTGLVFRFGGRPE